MIRSAEGERAPDFTLEAALPDASVRSVSLPGLTGRWTVVYIYPKDSTSG